MLAARGRDLPGDKKLAMMKCLIEADPTTAFVSDWFGENILHILCSTVCEGCEALVSYCLSMAPQMASMISRDGKLPLHVICDNAAHGHRLNAVLILLLEAYKMGTSVVDDMGCLPLHRAAHKLDVTAVRVVLEANPSALAKSSQHYGNPLCNAAGPTDPEGLAVVQYLYEQRPDSISETT
jgi:ankyrin repeat protein